MGPDAAPGPFEGGDEEIIVIHERTETTERSDRRDGPTAPLAAEPAGCAEASARRFARGAADLAEWTIVPPHGSASGEPAQRE